jgi:hypothetical protein
MPSEPLQRIQEDLATVKAALGTELPYDRSHVALYLLGSGLGVLLAGLPLLGLGVYVRPVLFVYVGLLVAAWLAQIRHLRTRRAAAPALWRWGRKEAVASLVAIALLVGYVVWAATLARWQGQWGLREAVAMASAVLFFLGTFGCMWVAVDRRRWHLLGGAAALVAGGALLPLCATREQFYVLVGAMVFAGGMSSGLLLLWQLRRHEVGHAD